MVTEENFFYRMDGHVLRYVQRLVTWVEKKFHVTSFTLTKIAIAILLCADVSHYTVLAMYAEQKGYAIFRLVLIVSCDALMSFYMWACTLQCRKDYATYGSCDPQKNPFNSSQRILRVFGLFFMTPLAVFQWYAAFTIYAMSISSIYHAISGTAFVVAIYFTSCIPLPRPVYAQRADREDTGVIDG